jgi:hypothetical protein
MERCWIIQKCTQRWIGTELLYEDFPTPEGLMTRDEMIEVLHRVCEEHQEDEFKGHNLMSVLASQKTQ